MSEPLVYPHFPYLPILVTLGHPRRRGEISTEALIDTGFDGDVVLPRWLVGNGEPPDGYLTWQLADGSEVLAAAYLGTVRVRDLGPFPVVITALGDEAMVGRTLVANFTVILDHGTRVVVEP